MLAASCTVCNTPQLVGRSRPNSRNSRQPEQSSTRIETSVQEPIPVSNCVSGYVLQMWRCTAEVYRMASQSTLQTLQRILGFPAAPQKRLLQIVISRTHRTSAMPCIHMLMAPLQLHQAAQPSACDATLPQADPLSAHHFAFLLSCLPTPAFLLESAALMAAPDLAGSVGRWLLDRWPGMGTLVRVCAR